MANQYSDMNKDIKLLNYYSEYLKWTNGKLPNEKPISEDQENLNNSTFNNDGILKIISNEKIINNQISRDTAFHNIVNELNIKKTKIDGLKLIFPFGINRSQLDAVENSISNNISIIQGPPGTGKTKTIVNLIANIVKNNCTVGVVSNNNSAVDNVKEKLEEEGLGILCTRMGNKNLMNETLKSFKNDKKEQYVSLKKVINNLNKNEYTTRIVDTIKIKEYYKHVYDLQRFKQKNRDINIELNNFYRLFPNCNEDIIFNSKISSKKKNKLKKIIYKKRTLSQRKLNRIVKKYKINLLLINPLLEINRFFDLSEMKMVESLIKNNIINIKNKLNRHYSTIEKDVISYGLSELKRHLSEKYRDENLIFKSIDNCIRKNNFKNEEFSITDLKKISPVILSTISSFPSNMGLGSVDYLIIDESSQSLTMNSLICAMYAKNIIVVGDLKQLPQIDDSNFEIFIKEKYKNIKTNIPNKFNINNNILSTITEIYGDKAIVTLKEHYRCSPSIINFCNKKFYNNELVIMTSDENIGYDPMEIVLYEGYYYKSVLSSKPESLKEAELFKRILEKSEFKDIGYISPYSGQANMVDKQRSNKSYLSDTVHKYQGRENEHIVFGVTNNLITNFNDNDSLINVAVSRAKNKFTLLVSDEALKSRKSSNILDLYKYIKYVNPNILRLQISIFDSLKDERQIQKLSYLKEKYKFDSDAELIGFKTINNILTKKYPSLELRQHTRLFRLLKDIDGFTDEEKRFLSHPWAHVDFLIINKFDKSPVCVVEVDGISFHNKNRAKWRDEIKDRALIKNKIKIIRWKTDGFNEEKKLIELLDNL